MGLKVDLLRSSFDLIAPKADLLAERFYDRLFADYPHLEPLFVDADIEDQQQKLIQSLAVVIKSLDNAKALTRYLHDLGGRHAEYGATEEDYEPVALTLLTVMAEIAGKAWNKKLESAWGDALSAVAEIMLEGAAKKTKKQPQLVGSSAAGKKSRESKSSSRNGERPASKTRATKAGSPARNEERSMSTTAKQSKAKAGQQVDSLDKFYNMIENVPINVLLADIDLNLVYMNASSTSTLKTLEQFLPKPVEQLVGESIDIFHQDPSHQRRLLSNPDNLPHTANIQVGPETLGLTISAVRDADEKYIGPMVTWEVVTEKLKTEAEMDRLQNMMDQIPINVMLANRDFEIVYINPASYKTLKPLEPLLPVPLDELQGQKIDILHKNPEMQRRIVGDPANLPHAANIKVGDETLSLQVSAIFDKDENYLGPMVTWEVVSDQVELADSFERDVKGIVNIVTSSATEMQASSKSMAATSEETSRQSQVVAAASEEATKNVETVASATEELSASISEIANHVQEASKMTSQAVEEAERTNATINDLGESSNEIGQVVKVITSIAQQTNLLALNATIEAARAGEAGKGFAVVANEVKELARQTAKATEEISQKISAIQNASGDAATAIESIGSQIGKINEIATTIAGAVEEQTAATNEISRNVAEASKGTAEVSSNIAAVSQAAEEGGKGAADILAAADGLAQESTRLDEMADGFLEKLRIV